VGFEEGDEGGADFVHWPGGVGCEFWFGGAHGCCFGLLCCWFGLYGIVLVLGLQATVVQIIVILFLKRMMHERVVASTWKHLDFERKDSSFRPLFI
jgi:uncharacterized membrane protein